jgi:hypothetical protein
MARIARGKVLEKIAQYWPGVDPQEIMNVLDQYGVESHERGRARVQLAVLKLSGGQRDRLEELVRMAKRDYRDIVAYAEYPEEMRIGFVGVRRLTAEEVKAVRRRDREQYLEWLGG